MQRKEFPTMTDREIAGIPEHPEKDLCLRLLTDAIHTVTSFTAFQITLENRQLIGEFLIDLSWILSKPHPQPLVEYLSFEYVCAVTGIEPAYLRERICRNLSRTVLQRSLQFAKEHIKVWYFDPVPEVYIFFGRD